MCDVHNLDAPAEPFQVRYKGSKHAYTEEVDTKGTGTPHGAY